MERLDRVPIHEVPKNEVYTLDRAVTVGPDTLVEAGGNFISVDKGILPAFERLVMEGLSKREGIAYLVTRIRNLVSCVLMVDGSVEGSGLAAHTGSVLNQDGARQNLAPSLFHGEKAGGVSIKAGDLPQYYKVVLTSSYQKVSRGGRRTTLHPMEDSVVPAHSSPDGVLAMMLGDSLVLRKGTQVVTNRKGGMVEILIWPADGGRASNKILVDPDTVLDVFIPMDPVIASGAGTWN